MGDRECQGEGGHDQCWNIAMMDKLAARGSRVNVEEESATSSALRPNGAKTRLARWEPPCSACLATETESVVDGWKARTWNNHVEEAIRLRPQL